MELKNKVVLITGGAKRIGRVLVEGFAERGARVAFTYRNSQKEAQGLAAGLKEKKCAVSAFRAELGELADVQKILTDIRGQWGGVDVLINSASDFYSTPLDKMTLKDWDHFLKVNLTGSFPFAWQAGLEMKKRGAGKIINIADWAAEKPCLNYLPYSVSKSGIIGLTRSLALELAPEVCVNAISPGPVLPPAGATDKEKKALAESVPLKRLGSPGDVLATALFLAEQTDYMTGAVLPVEGGRLLM